MVSSVTALRASHSLPPSDEIQMETYSGLPTLLTIMAPQIFFFISLQVSCALKYFYAAMDTFRLELFCSFCTGITKASKLTFFFFFYRSFNAAMSNLRLSFSRTYQEHATCYLERHIKRRGEYFIFLDFSFSPGRFICTTQTRLKGSTEVQDFGIFACMDVRTYACIQMHTDVLYIQTESKRVF